MEKKIQVADKTQFELAVSEAVFQDSQIIMNASAFGKTVEEFQALGEAIQYASDHGVDVTVCANKVEEINNSSATE